MSTFKRNMEVALICNLKGQLKKRTEERNEARAKVEALFSMCKIIYCPEGERMMEYPIEHNLAAGKDMRKQIETEIAKGQ